jgi:hypothetical protein
LVSTFAGDFRSKRSYWEQLKKEEQFLRDTSTKTILFIVPNSADYAKVDIEFLEKVKAGSSVAMSNG